MTTPQKYLFVAAITVLLGSGGAYLFANDAFAQKAPASSSASSGKTLKQAIKPDATYATIDGDKITGRDVQAFVTKLPPELQAAPADRLLEMLVNQMVNDRLVAREAAGEKLAEDAKVKARLKDAQEQIIRDRFVEKRLEGKVTDAQLRKKYDELVKTVPVQDEVRASHILVADEKTANTILARLGKGEDFAKLAKEFSTDPTKANGGDLGYFTQSAMVKEFGDAAFAMKNGEVSKKPVKTQFGYHVIKVTGRRKQERPSFDAVKDRLRAQATEDQIRKIVEDLRAKYKVEVTVPKA